MKSLSIMKKELVDALRDRRGLTAALSFGLIGPVLIVFSINMAAVANRDTGYEPFRLCGGGDAPDLVAHLRSTGLGMSDSARICLEIPEDYAARLASGEQVRVRVLADLTSAGNTTNRIA
jgi:hypothetical protein